jgi:hypothetical protein
VWVSNTDRGTIVRIPIRRDGRAGPLRVAVTGLPVGVDNVTVIGRDDTVIAAIAPSHQVVVTRPGAGYRTVLTAADGLDIPTHVQIRRHTLYVTNFGDWTSPQPDPSLIVATLR